MWYLIVSIPDHCTLTYFNVKKCKVLHIGNSNAYYDYSMNGEGLQSVTEETDLNMIVSNDLNFDLLF